MKAKVPTDFFGLFFLRKFCMKIASATSCNTTEKDKYTNHILTLALLFPLFAASFLRACMCTLWKLQSLTLPFTEARKTDRHRLCTWNTADKSIYIGIGISVLWNFCLHLNWNVVVVAVDFFLFFLFLAEKAEGNDTFSLLFVYFCVWFQSTLVSSFLLLLLWWWWWS